MVWFLRSAGNDLTVIYTRIRFYCNISSTDTFTRVVTSVKHQEICSAKITTFQLKSIVIVAINYTVSYILITHYTLTKININHKGDASSAIVFTENFLTR